jgi:gamma-glutamyltranspeptidase/glutathione hydrolase/leukotriene-C4 hydrolase
LQSIINILDYGKDLYHAIAFPRVHHQLLPNMVIAENNYPQSLLRELEARNHTIWQLPQFLCVSAVQAVRRMSDGTLEAASDPRKTGLAAAY